MCVHPFRLLERQDDSIVNNNTVHFGSYVGMLGGDERDAISLQNLKHLQSLTTVI